MTISSTPTNLGQLRAALIERCLLDPADPDAQPAALNPIINEAIARFDLAEPRGWPWDWQDGFWQPIGTATPDPTQTWGPTGFVSKVRYVLLGAATPSQAPVWQEPLEQVSREQQLRDYPLDNVRGRPRCYSIIGQDGATTEPIIAMYLRPLPDMSYQLRIAGFAAISDLVADNKPSATLNDFQIEDWAQLVIEWAAALVYRGRGDLAEAIAAAANFTAGVLELRRGQRRRYGAGTPGRPEMYQP